MPMISFSVARNKGFTLVELAVVIIVSGVIALILFNALNYLEEQQRVQTTIYNMNIVREAIGNYEGSQLRYPCPASRDAVTTSVAYGSELATNQGNNPICTINTPSTASAPGYDGGANEVVIGAVPFKEIAAHIAPMKQSDGHYVTLTSNLALDGWGNRLTYAVTKSQTQQNTYRDEDGKVNVVDENNRVLIYKPGSVTAPSGAHYAVLSYGDDGRGAYSKDGVLVRSCGNITIPNPPPVNTTALNELVNCNDLGTFMQGLRNLSQYSYNDDFLQYTVVQRSDLWSNANSDNITMRVNNTNLGNVGIGINPATIQANYGHTPQRLNILGPIKAASFQTAQYCDQDNLNCIAATKIGGNDPAMQCGQGQVMTGISNGAAQCANSFNAPIIKSCPSGQYIIALSNLGRLQCWNPATNIVTTN